MHLIMQAIACAVVLGYLFAALMVLQGLYMAVKCFISRTSDNPIHYHYVFEILLGIALALLSSFIGGIITK